MNLLLGLGVCVCGEGGSEWRIDDFFAYCHISLLSTQKKMPSLVLSIKPFPINLNCITVNPERQNCNKEY